VDARRPAPFIVGAPRSGTTLLRLMLDAHSDLAIPAETGMFMTLAATSPQPATPEALFRMITDSPTWTDFGLDAASFEQRLSCLQPFTLADGLRAFYGLYAERHGKTRWGDKSPLHCYHLPLIAETLPEAHILHVIRDGRDVATSLREVWFAPTQDATGLADYWAAAVRAGREGGARCRHYTEVRYERLVSSPRAVLDEVCAYLDLPFEHAMLDYHHSARERLSEASARLLPDGTVISLEQRLAQQRLTSAPPDESRVGRWRDAMSADDVAAFEARAGSLLAELGYRRTLQT
jgi:hypothetical protein